MTHGFATTAHWRYAVFTTAMRELCATFRFSVTSWWRTPSHNAELPGHASDSEHQVGTAADGVFDVGAEPEPGYFKAWCRERGLDVEQVTAAAAGHPAPAPASGETAVAGERPHWHLQLRTTLD